MLKVYECIDRLKNFLSKNTIAFKIIINTDTTISVRMVSDDENLSKAIEDFCDVKIYIEECYTSEEYESDEFLQKGLNNDIDWSFKKRFDSFDFNKKIHFDIPIISFYSYKGGVGRTSSLIAFASYYSNVKKKNVVILDFDFEAPGIINFFDIDFEKNPKNGIIEYLLDLQATKKELDFNNYYLKVSKRFSGEGNIYVLPAGNIFDLKNIKSYIEGLSRIDINTAEAILQKLEVLLKNIKKELNPDVILIDSRTGFNDVFGLLSHSLSDLIIGFFTNNKQNAPGLELFLDIIQGNNAPDFILVNSQIHFDRGYKKRFEGFIEKVCKILKVNKNELGNITYIERIPAFIELGSDGEDNEEFIDFVKAKYELTNYRHFFNLITDILSKKEDSLLGDEKKNKQNLDVIQLKFKLLNKLQQNYPKLYAEDTKYNDEFLERDFYIRTCMEDIFNFDKFLLIGGKGTGKTAFYNALKSNIFVEYLQKKANKAQKKFLFIDIISLRSDKHKNKYFPIELLKDYQNKDYRFYDRFWKVYILNSLALDENKIFYGKCQFNFNFKPIELNDKLTEKIENFFYEYIDDKFSIVEDEFLKLDEFLKKWDINLIITFDQLDFIVPPIFWDKAIVPLIDFAKTNSYFKIYPKLFIRRDLFEKLSNYTNKESLRDVNSINLEWSKDEIFGFFFKVVFAYTNEEFFEIMKIYNGENEKFIKPIKNEISKKNRYNQVPLEKYYLMPLVETFFGKYAYVGKNEFKRKMFGLMYDWFYNNLKNADDTISLRPFLDLIKEAIKRYLDSNNFDKFEKPILPAIFHTNKEVRKIAVKRHFEDLASEAGNEDFRKIIEHIQNTASSFPKKFRKRILEGKIYEEFLEYLFNNLDLNVKNVNQIEEILIINGVIKVDFIRSNYKKAEFAFLYKYYLGLEG
jgi:cellulose biosynthesis protein BcsQ